MKYCKHCNEPAEEIQRPRKSVCNDCLEASRKATRRRHYYKDPEKARADSRKWHHDNKEYCSKRSREYYEKNKDIIAQKQARYYQANKSKFSKYQAISRLRYHTDPVYRKHYLERCKKWRENNKEWKAEWTRQYERKEHVKLKKKVRAKTREFLANGQIKKKDLCESCQISKATDVHHMSYDKPDSYKDILFLCNDCHMKAHVLASLKIN